MLNKKGRFTLISLLVFLFLVVFAQADNASNSTCNLKNFASLYRYDEQKNKNLATALYSISSAFEEHDVKLTPQLLASIMATLDKEVGGEKFLPVEENGDYGQGGNCSYKIGGKCRKNPYDGGIDYKGRGYIQITHKENYAKYCGKECIGTSTPELDVCGCKNKKKCTVTDENICPQLKALKPEYAGKIFAAYYVGTKYRNDTLVQLAEKKSYRTVGEKINGGQSYADDFAKKAEKYLQIIESENGSILDCLKTNKCEDGNCNQTNQPPVVPGPTGCNHSYIFSCNDTVSIAMKKVAPLIFKIIVRECPQGQVYGKDRRCHEECGSGTYCTGNSKCYYGNCLACDPGFYLGTDGLCYPEKVSRCDPGYILGEDGYCHVECGSGTYCKDSECYNGNCIKCDPGYYLAVDGLCYPENGGEDKTCPQGYVYGENLCNPECGSGTYCLSGSTCLNGQCLWCENGYYLAQDGNCYPENGGEKTCPGGYILGEDDYCHPECGNSGTYCIGGSECFNNQCLTCDPGYYLAQDGRCYPDLSCEAGYILGNDLLCHPECGSGIYCTGDSTCFNGKCLSCENGYYLAQDGQCYPENGYYCEAGYYLATDGKCYPENSCGEGYYLATDGKCYPEYSCEEGYYLATDGKCYPEYSCDFGYILGEDGLCHKECGISGTYCTGDSQCYFGKCVSCNEGYYLGTDGKCYPEKSCDLGYILGNDDLCHPECGNSGTYCTGDSQCFNGRCLSCNPGYYLGTDGKCYSEKSCDPGYILGNDDLCHPECGNSGTYCTGDATCYNNRCLSCNPGYYLGTDGRCYSEKSCNAGYILGNDDLCHPECGNSGTYCTGDSQCFNGRCLSCNPGYYLGTDGRCYSEKSCNAGYILGNDDLCHPECGNSGTYCTGNSQCYNGRCLSCSPGYYLATDGYCYPY